MRILLKSLKAKCTRTAFEVTLELAKEPVEGSITEHMNGLNRMGLPVLVEPDLVQISMLCSLSGIPGIWSVTQSSPTTYTLRYHDAEVMRHLERAKKDDAERHFAKEKLTIYTRCLIDVLHVFNHPWFKERIDLFDTECTELRFAFNSQPLVVDLREMTTNIDQQTVRETLPKVADLIIARIEANSKWKPLGECLRKRQPLSSMIPSYSSYSSGTILRNLKRVDSDPFITIQNAPQHLVLSDKIEPDLIMTALYVALENPSEFQNARTLHMVFESLVQFYAAIKPVRGSHEYLQILDTLAQTRQFVRMIGNKMSEATDKSTMLARERAEAFLNSSDHPLIIRADGYPLKEEGWPKDRDLPNVSRLHAVQTESTLLSEHPNPPANLIDEISNVENPFVLEVGPGTGRALAQFMELCKEQGKSGRFIGVGVTPLAPEFEKRFDAVIYGSIPECAELLRPFYGTFDFILETYSAATYTRNPLQAMMLYLTLLRPQGRCRMVISGVQKLTDGTPIGFVITRAKLKALFKALGCWQFSIHETKIRSQVAGFEDTTMIDYVVNFKKPAELELALIQTKSYEELSQILASNFGEPEVYEHKDSFGKFTNFGIKARVYKEDTTQIDSRDLVKCGLESYLVESMFGDGPNACFMFCFETSKQAIAFLQKFNERFGHRGRDDWQGKIDERSSKQVLITYCPYLLAKDYYEQTLLKKVPGEAVIKALTRDTPKNRQYWLAVWLDANKQWKEYYDIPQLDAITTHDAEFIIPTTNPPMSLTVVCNQMDKTQDFKM